MVPSESVKKAQEHSPVHAGPSSDWSHKLAEHDSTPVLPGSDNVWSGHKLQVLSVGTGGAVRAIPVPWGVRVLPRLAFRARSCFRAVGAGRAGARGRECRCRHCHGSSRTRRARSIRRPRKPRPATAQRAGRRRFRMRRAGLAAPCSR
eukprot:2623979-Rhodomonas_salina.3